MSKVRYCPYGGKVIYQDQDEARAAAQAVSGKFRATREKLYPYQCASCREWHIGRTEPTAWTRRSQKRAAR